MACVMVLPANSLCGRRLPKPGRSNQPLDQRAGNGVRVLDDMTSYGHNLYWPATKAEHKTRLCRLEAPLENSPNKIRSAPRCEIAEAASYVLPRIEPGFPHRERVALTIWLEDNRCCIEAAIKVGELIRDRKLVLNQMTHIEKGSHGEILSFEEQKRRPRYCRQAQGSPLRHGWGRPGNVDVWECTAKLTRATSALPGQVGTNRGSIESTGRYAQ